jgi:phosphatidylglycerol:prolipoprotein diacylglycerol transferase
MLTHPNFDPVVFSLGPLAVRWYGLMYLLAFASFWWLGTRRIEAGRAPVTREQLDELSSPHAHEAQQGALSREGALSF